MPRKLLPKPVKETTEEITARSLGLSIAKHKGHYKVWFESPESYDPPSRPLRDFHEGGQLDTFVNRHELEGFFQGFFHAKRIFNR